MVNDAIKACKDAVARPAFQGKNLTEQMCDAKAEDVKKFANDKCPIEMGHDIGGDAGVADCYAEAGNKDDFIKLLNAGAGSASPAAPGLKEKIEAALKQTEGYDKLSTFEDIKEFSDLPADKRAGLRNQFKLLMAGTGTADDLAKAIAAAAPVEISGFLSTMHGYMGDHGYFGQSVLGLSFPITLYSTEQSSIELTPSVELMFRQLPPSFGDERGWLVKLDKPGKLATFNQVDLTLEWKDPSFGASTFRAGYGDEDPKGIVSYGMKPFSGPVKNEPVGDGGWGIEAKWEQTFLSASKDEVGVKKYTGWNIRPFAALRYDFACNPDFDLIDFDDDGEHYVSGKQACVNFIAGSVFTFWPGHGRIFLLGHAEHSSPDEGEGTTALGVQYGIRVAPLGQLDDDDGGEAGSLVLDVRGTDYGVDYDKDTVNTRAEYIFPFAKGGLRVYSLWGVGSSSSIFTQFAGATPAVEAGLQDDTGLGGVSGQTDGKVEKTASEFQAGLVANWKKLTGTNFGVTQLSGGNVSTERVEHTAGVTRDPDNTNRSFFFVNQKFGW